jgi:hypothetical protein
MQVFVSEIKPYRKVKPELEAKQDIIFESVAYVVFLFCCGHVKDSSNSRLMRTIYSVIRW